MRIAGTSPTPTPTSTASVSLRDPVGVLEQLVVAGGNRQGDAIGQLEPCVLPHRVDAVDQLVDAALECQLLVDGRVDRDGHARVTGDGPPVLPGPFDENLLRGQLMAGNPESAALELLEVARLKRSAHGTELLPELRPEGGQVRLHPQLRVDVTELDLLHAELLGDLVGVRGGERCTLDDDPSQRLAKLEP